LQVVIIGAGLAGLACAQALKQNGHSPTLFDKGRGLGGRMSTRRAQFSSGIVTFDHGAPFITAQGAGFAAELARWCEEGLVAPWHIDCGKVWVGTPTMHSPIVHLAKDHDIRLSSHVMGLLRDGTRWLVMLNDGSLHGPYDAAITAVPAEQAAAFLGMHDLVMASCTVAARSKPRWTAMIAYAGKMPISQDVIRDRGPVVFAARNSAKPGRPDTEAWVIHANLQWSMTHLESEPGPVANALGEWLGQQAGNAALPDCVYLTAHRWRYALPQPSRLGALWNADLRLGACGDWLLGPTVEDAWLSGRQLAEKILGSGP
jgi:predicted NAD/FAD-dependent oxidoreductase